MRTIKNFARGVGACRSRIERRDASRVKPKVGSVMGGSRRVADGSRDGGMQDVKWRET